MSEGNSTTVDVELLGRDLEQTLVCDGDGGEGLVDLELGDLVDGEPGLLECERDSLGGSNGEVNRSAGGVGEGCNLEESASRPFRRE